MSRIAQNIHKATREEEYWQMNSIHERFLDKIMVDPNSGCWLWTAHLTSRGYGHFGFGKTMVGAHRVSWTLYRGDLPPNNHVLHKCDVPSCVNPDHLFLGTHADNMADKASKERQVRGERTTGSKLCAEKIIEIRSLQGKMSQRQIGRQFDMNQTTIGKILRREYWKHVP